MTLAAAGGLALLTLAQPAFQDTGPGWLKRLDLSVTFRDRFGQEIGHRGILHDDSPALADLPQHLIQAVLATEDRRFYQHWGIDPIGIGRALIANAEADGVVQGGSTITQQLAKSIFLSGERTLERKVREAFLALWLECQLSKAQILKLYLDRAYLGAGTFGVEAAAEFYFHKSARTVSLAEAAVLAGLLKAPSRYGPHLGGPASEARASDVLDRMLESGFIDRPEAEAARREPAVAVAAAAGERPDYYLDWAFRQVQRLAANGRLGRDSVLVVDTPFDPDLQRHSEAVLIGALDRDGERLAVDQAAAVVMEPSGAVRAMVGGRDYGESQFNRAADALRQPGSAFKPFVYAAALAGTDLRPDSIVADAPICLGSWCPKNYGRSFAGAMPLATALARSINTVAVRLSAEIGRAAGEWTLSRQARFGRARIIALARSLGLTTALHDTPSLPLGVSEVKLLDLTASYAAFAHGGVRAEPSAIVAVRNTRGTVLYASGHAEGRRVLSPGLVADMNTMLARVVDAGTGRRAALAGHRAAGKTGTTNAYRDAWFVGFTGHLVAGIWFGNNSDKPMKRVTGGTLPAAAWHDIMTFAHRDLAPVPLPGLDGSIRIATGRGTAGGFAEPGPAMAGRRGFEVVTGSRAGFVEGR